MSRKQDLDQPNLHQLVKRDNFCILPFVHQYVATTGAVNLCCVADYTDPIEENISTLDKAWTSPAMQESRRRMLNNEFEPRCTLCYKQGEASDRMVVNKNWSERYPDIKLDIEKGNDIGNPVFLDLRPGRLCNLKCRMCFSDVSSAIAEELEEHPEIAELIGDVPRDISEWLDNDEAFESVKRAIPHTQVLKLAGGEPLFMPGVLKLLRWMIESNNTHVYLDITTNGTRLQGKTYRLLEHFGKDIQFSMCGIGYTNDYIREGADWNQLKDAYKQYRDMYRTQIHIMSTVQLYNLFNIEEIIEWWYANKPPGGKLIFNLVNFPEDLSIDLAEKEDRLERAEHLRKYQNILGTETRINHIIERLETVEDTDYTVELRKRWVERTSNFDTIRNQDINKVHSKLGNYFKQWQKK